MSLLCKFKRYLATVMITYFCMFHALAKAENVLVFNVTGQPPLNTINLDGFMDEVTREALRKIDYKLVINRQPAERGLRSVNEGLLDGEMSRIKGLEDTYPNLIRVQEKIMDWEFTVFSKNKIDMQPGWEVLKGKNIAFIKGWKIFENNVPASSRITKTKNATQLFSLIKKDRTDFILYEKWGGKYLTRELQIEKLESLSPALAVKEMYIYLNKKHEKVIPELTQALISMKKDGSYQRLVDKHLTSLDK